MKYIRTKDKIEKVPNDYANKLVETPTLKIADTIEELCDEFVFTKGNIKNVFLPMTFHKEKDLTFYDEIYGAIWTDKGLIYVAKMNDKGELELL